MKPVSVAMNNARSPAVALVMRERLANVYEVDRRTFHDVLNAGQPAQITGHCLPQRVRHGVVLIHPLGKRRINIDFLPVMR